jgi:hypothetical protein
MKWESKYTDELLEKYGFLLLMLNDIKELSQMNVKDTITQWQMEYGPEIKELTREYMAKLDRYSNKQILGNETYKQQEEKINDLTNTNYQLLNLTTDYIGQQYIQIGLLESKDNFSPEQADQILQTTVNQTEDKVTLYATMAIAGGMIDFITTNAMSDGWTEGLWRTQRDSRVRESHAKMDNKWVRLDDPNPQPAGFQPGCDYNCRCWYIDFCKPNPKGGWIYASDQK